MTLGPTPERLDGLRRRLREAGMDAALLLHHRDVLYYAGTARPATLLVTPTEAVLFVRRGLDFARREATVPRVEAARGFAAIARRVGQLGIASGVVGTELDLAPARLCDRIRAAMPSWSLADASPLILAQRAIKDEPEIAATRRAAAVADAAQQVIPELVAPGRTEVGLAAEAEAVMRRVGHELGPAIRHPGASGPGIMVVSGDNLTIEGGYGLVVTGAGLSPAMPYGPSRRPLEMGDLVVVDLGPMVDGYTADLARTFVVGSAADWQQKLFEVVREAQEIVLDAIQPGVTAAELFDRAEAVVKRGAPPLHPPESLPMPGFVGHGLGLEMDEPPVLAAGVEARLEAGMVLAVEIEVSARAARAMVKLEDTVVVRPDGCELLTHARRELVPG